MGCNISISSSNLKDFIDSLVVSCIWQINNHTTVIYLCILFHKAHSAKRLKKIFCLHSSSSFFSLLQAHPHPNPTWWVSHSLFSTECLLLHSLLTSFLWILWWKLHNLQRNKAFKTFPKGTSTLIWVIFQDPTDLTLHDLHSLYQKSFKVWEARLVTQKTQTP